MVIHVRLAYQYWRFSIACISKEIKRLIEKTVSTKQDNLKFQLKERYLVHFTRACINMPFGYFFLNPKIPLYRQTFFN